MHSSLDVELHDNDLIDEIGLLTDLMVTATEAAGPLELRVIDSLLGLRAADHPVVPRQRLAG